MFCLVELIEGRHRGCVVELLARWRTANQRAPSQRSRRLNPKEESRALGCSKDASTSSLYQPNRRHTHPLTPPPCLSPLASPLWSPARLLARPSPPPAHPSPCSSRGAPAPTPRPRTPSSTRLSLAAPAARRTPQSSPASRSTAPAMRPATRSSSTSWSALSVA
jgi:hypothetical protein